MPPLAIAAGIGAVASIGGAVIGAKSNSKAAKSAARTSQANMDNNNALARENRNFAQGVLQPYSNAGLTAQNALSGLLYGSSQPSALAPAGGAGGGVDWDAYVRGNPDAMANWNAIQGTTHDDPFEGSLAAFGQHHYQADGARRDLAAYTPGAQQAAPGGVNSSQSAWDQFRNSSNYQFRYGEGMKGLNLNLANNGYQGSGAAVKEAIKYGQNFASNELGNYMQLLQGQQQIGMGAASAMVGVGQNTTNALMANNSSNAQNQANSALIQGRNNANMWGGIAQGIGSAAGTIAGGFGGGGSSYTNLSSGGSGGSWGTFG